MMVAGLKPNISIGEVVGIVTGQCFFCHDGSHLFLALSLKEIVIRFSGQNRRMRAAGKSGQDVVNMIHGTRTIQTESKQRLNCRFPKIRFSYGNRSVRFGRINLQSDGLFEVFRAEGRQIQILLQIDIFPGKQGANVKHFLHELMVNIFANVKHFFT